MHFEHFLPDYTKWTPFLKDTKRLTLMTSRLKTAKMQQVLNRKKARAIERDSIQSPVVTN